MLLLSIIDPVHESCDVHPTRRILCRGAYPGILQHSCELLDCCYDNRIPDAPSCFPHINGNLCHLFARQLKHCYRYSQIRPSTCDIDFNLTDCGIVDPVYELCSIDRAKRTSCPGAFWGITPQFCHALGCCFDTAWYATGLACYAEKPINA